MLRMDLTRYCYNRKSVPSIATVITFKCGLECVNSFYINLLPPSQRHGISLKKKCKPFRRSNCVICK